MDNNLNETMKNLLIGNQRFIDGESDVKLDDEYIKSLSKGQTPIAAILTCSDSRIVPEYIFDQNIGELFSVRVAGNVFTSTVAESIAVAIEEFGVKTVVVMSHTNCGAVDLSLNKKQGVIYKKILDSVSNFEKIDAKELTLENSLYVASEIRTKFDVDVYATNYELETKKVIML